MANRRSRVVFGALALAGAAVTAIALAVAPRPTSAAGTPLPATLSDQDFWRFVSDHSESSGSFPRENLTSNETMFESVIPDLQRRAPSGGVYLGVGPEQNFTYMAAIKPAFAVIFDIRRGNLDVQLLYKAVFEMSADRADFVSLLFSRPRPAGLSASSTVDALFSAYGRVPASKTLHDRNLQAIEDRLTKVHGFGMAPADIEWVQYVFDTFYRYGFRIRPSPSYDELMTAADRAGVQRSYLASEANYAFLRQLEKQNLVVPVVGDFAGRKAIREVAAYLKAHEATVSAFYLSNVEDYLYQDGKWDAFCRNAAMLPLNGASTFIRSTSRGRSGSGFGGFGVGFVSSLGAMAEEVRACR